MREVEFAIDQLFRTGPYTNINLRSRVKEEIQEGESIEEARRRIRAEVLAEIMEAQDQIEEWEQKRFDLENRIPDPKK